MSSIVFFWLFHARSFTLLKPPNQKYRALWEYLHVSDPYNRGTNFSVSNFGLNHSFNILVTTLSLTSVFVLSVYFAKQLKVTSRLLTFWPWFCDPWWPKPSILVFYNYIMFTTITRLLAFCKLGFILPVYVNGCKYYQVQWMTSLRH